MGGGKKKKKKKKKKGGGGGGGGGGFKVTENKDAAYGVAYAEAIHFDELPEKVQNLLFKVAENKDAASIQ